MNPSVLADLRPAAVEPPRSNFAVFYDQDTIQKWIEDSCTNPPTISVPAALSRNVKGHGTHVTSIAAGRKAGNFAGGVAPEARILVVVAASGQNIPYSMSHLAALKFIYEFVTNAKLPVVVNLNAGMNAGAHDGRSALEVGFDEFSGSGRTPGRIIVKSAGNERTNRGHAKVQLLPDVADTLLVRPDTRSAIHPEARRCGAWLQRRGGTGRHVRRHLHDERHQHGGAACDWDRRAASLSSIEGRSDYSESQVGAALRQNAKSSTGSYANNMGFGLVDVEALLIGF